MEAGDTFYEDVLDFHKFAPDMYEKFDSCTIVGDKRPDLYESYDQLFENFPDAKVLFIYRDIEQVASSYAGRVKSGESWPASKDFKKAVIEWNQSLFFTLEAIKKGHNIKVVEYNTIFSSDSELNDLLQYLNLTGDQDLKEGLKNIRARAKQLTESRQMLLNEDELIYVNENAQKFLITDLENSLI